LGTNRTIVGFVSNRFADEIGFLAPSQRMGGAETVTRYLAAISGALHIGIIRSSRIDDRWDIWPSTGYGPLVRSSIIYARRLVSSIPKSISTILICFFTHICPICHRAFMIKMGHTWVTPVIYVLY
jgi:hypothetical protein